MGEPSLTRIYDDLEEDNRVSDKAIEILKKNGLVKEMEPHHFQYIDKKLVYHCKQCGAEIEHRFDVGGLYVSCNKCGINWILYFNIDDLVFELERGSVTVKQ